MSHIIIYYDIYILSSTIRALYPCTYTASLYHSRYFSFRVTPSESRWFSKAGWGTVVAFTRSDATPLLQRSSNRRASSGAFRVEIIINLICLRIYALLLKPDVLYYIQGDSPSMLTPVFPFNNEFVENFKYLSIVGAYLKTMFSNYLRFLFL